MKYVSFIYYGSCNLLHRSYLAMSDLKLFTSTFFSEYWKQLKFTFSIIEFGIIFDCFKDAFLQIPLAWNAAKSEVKKRSDRRKALIKAHVNSNLPRDTFEGISGRHFIYSYVWLANFWFSPKVGESVTETNTFEAEYTEVH